MATQWLPSTQDLRGIVSEEITLAGGKISDCCDCGSRLFLRAILPGVREVRPKDGMQGGLALMAVDDDVRVHPYVFRQVCRNGAIMAQTIETRVEAGYQLESVRQEFRETVRACLDPQVFAECTNQMRSATESKADLVINLM